MIPIPVDPVWLPLSILGGFFLLMLAAAIYIDVRWGDKP